MERLARAQGRRSLAFVAALSAFVLTVGLGYYAAPAQAQTALPPSLDNEIFIAFEPFGFPGSGTVQITEDCEDVGAQPQTVTLTYRAEGTAVGPYPGTFTEQGTVTLALTTPVVVGFYSGVVSSWTASFTIDSPVGDVSGTKTLSTSLQAFCNARMPPATSFPGEVAVATLTYDATIRTTAGTFRDHGMSVDQVIRQCLAVPPFCTPGETRVFVEQFTLSLGVLPLDTSGKATGGGQVVSGSDPFERVTFGFNVRKSEDETRLNGTCNVLDHTTRTHVKCLTVEDYQQVGNTATWSGQANVNGVIEDYEITVQDNGEPNQGVDMFRLDTETYDVPLSPVTHGNVQVHKQASAL